MAYFRPSFVALCSITIFYCDTKKTRSLKNCRLIKIQGVVCVRASVARIVDWILLMRVFNRDYEMCSNLRSWCNTRSKSTPDLSPRLSYSMLRRTQRWGRICAACKDRTVRKRCKRYRGTSTELQSSVENSYFLVKKKKKLYTEYGGNSFESKHFSLIITIL